MAVHQGHGKGKVFDKFYFLLVHKQEKDGPGQRQICYEGEDGKAEHVSSKVGLHGSFLLLNFYKIFMNM